jgi:hypothetical protein
MESGRPWAAPAVKPTGVARTLSLVAASHGAQHIYTGLLPLTYPAVLIAFHLSVGSLGLAMGAVGVAGGLSQISAGAVSQRVRARWVLGSQNLVLGLCALLGSWAPVYAAFAGAQGVAQLASSQQHPLGSSIAARAYPERRGMALSTHNIGGSIGSLLVPLPAAVMISPSPGSARSRGRSAPPEPGAFICSASAAASSSTPRPPGSGPPRPRSQPVAAGSRF